MRALVAAFAATVLCACSPKPLAPGALLAPAPAASTAASLGLRAVADPLALPASADGIGFDDLQWAPGIARVLVPAGRSGKLDLVDPATKKVTAIDGFSSEQSYAGGHAAGTTSADEGRGVIYAIDRTRVSLAVVDPVKAAIVASARLASSPGYVRYVAPTNEVWVSEPDAKRIEVFSLGKGGAPVHAAFVAVEGGPESLLVDATRGRAYSNLWSGFTVAIDLRARRVAATWKNGCQGSRGLALDEARGILLVGCEEGRGVALDVAHDGTATGSIADGSGTDVIAFSPAKHHLYLPGADSATMAIVGVGSRGALTLLGRVDTARGAGCVTADDRGGIWVCDPKEGRLLRYDDVWP